MPKIYFPGLNALRFFAALSVIFFHLGRTELFGKIRQGFFLSHLVLNGSDAVTLFFVLSGFLITFLLLTELKNTQTIQVRKFYVRRILRIWPLYYLMIFLGFVAFPMLEIATKHISTYSLIHLSTTQYLLKLSMHLTFLPHVTTYFGHTIIGIDQLWSIGIEESFYLVWPVLVLIFSKHIGKLLFSILGLKLVCYLVYALLTQSSGTPRIILDGLGLINFIRVENMAIGGVGAYILFQNWTSVLRVIYHPVIEKAILVLVVANIFLFTGENNVVINQLLAILYVLLILNVSSNPNATLKLENRVFNSLGQISFGIYMYHVIIIYVVSLFLSQSIFLVSNSVVLTLLLYVGIPLGTIAVAHFSYYYFEQPFLRLKQRFTVINSGLPEPLPPEGKHVVMRPVSS